MMMMIEAQSDSSRLGLVTRTVTNTARQSSKTPSRFRGLQEWTALLSFLFFFTLLTFAGLCYGHRKKNSGAQWLPALLLTAGITQVVFSLYGARKLYTLRHMQSYSHECGVMKNFIWTNGLLSIMSFSHIVVYSLLFFGTGPLEHLTMFTKTLFLSPGYHSITIAAAVLEALSCIAFVTHTLSGFLCWYHCKKQSLLTGNHRLEEEIPTMSKEFHDIPDVEEVEKY